MFTKLIFQNAVNEKRFSWKGRVPSRSARGFKLTSKLFLFFPNFSAQCKKKVLQVLDYTKDKHVVLSKIKNVWTLNQIPEKREALLHRRRFKITNQLFVSLILRGIAKYCFCFNGFVVFTLSVILGTD